MRVLVTGATGTIGGEVARLLTSEDVKVRAGIRSEMRGAELKRLGAELAIIDYGRPETLRPAMAGVDALFLLTPFDSEMVRMTAAIVAEAKKAGVKRIVKLSAFGAGEGAITLGRWHRQAEKVIENSGIPYTFLRPTSFMQNLLRMAPAIREEERLYVPAGDGKSAFIDARDIAAAAAETLIHEGHEGKIYTLTGPEVLGYRQVASLLSKALGKRVIYINIAEQDARRSMRSMPDWMVEALLELYRVVRVGRMEVITDTVEELTGKRPRTLGAFFREHAAEFTLQPTVAGERPRATARA
jgi:uncharacterized protein YbjT (DUF2867 family)